MSVLRFKQDDGTIVYRKLETIDDTIAELSAKDPGFLESMAKYREEIDREQREYDEMFAQKQARRGRVRHIWSKMTSWATPRKHA